MGRGLKGEEENVALPPEPNMLRGAWKQSQGSSEQVCLKHTRFPFKTGVEPTTETLGAKIKTLESASDSFRSLSEPGGCWTELTQWTQYLLSRSDIFNFPESHLPPPLYAQSVPVHILISQDHSSASFSYSSLS